MGRGVEPALASHGYKRLQTAILVKGLNTLSDCITNSRLLIWHLQLDWKLKEWQNTCKKHRESAKVELMSEWNCLQERGESHHPLRQPQKTTPSAVFTKIDSIKHPTMAQERRKSGEWVEEKDGDWAMRKNKGDTSLWLWMTIGDIVSFE